MQRSKYPAAQTHDSSHMLFQIFDHGGPPKMNSQISAQMQTVLIRILQTIVLREKFYSSRFHEHVMAVTPLGDFQSYEDL